MHYTRLLRGRPLDAPRQLRGRPFEERFWAKVDKNGPPSAYRPELGPCWLWTGALSWGGYGVLGNPSRAAHRVGYELQVGPIPPGLDLDHLCRVRNCVRGEHLEPVTERENALRSDISLPAVNAARTECVNGHRFDDVNTYTDPSGRRRCRICQRERTRRYRMTRINSDNQLT